MEGDRGMNMNFKTPNTDYMERTIDEYVGPGLWEAKFIHVLGIAREMEHEHRNLRAENLMLKRRIPIAETCSSAS